jgi:hypothetical protein
MKKILALVSLISVIGLTSCTENQRAKNWGGTATVDIPEGQRLIDVTWKGDQIWYLTDDMPVGYEAKTYNFLEESSYGMVEGKVVFKEHGSGKIDNPNVTNVN